MCPVSDATARSVAPFRDASVENPLRQINFGLLGTSLCPDVSEDNGVDDPIVGRQVHQVRGSRLYDLRAWRIVEFEVSR